MEQRSQLRILNTFEIIGSLQLHEGFSILYSILSMISLTMTSTYKKTRWDIPGRIRSYLLSDGTHKRVEDGPGLSWCRARPTGLQYILKQANKWRRLLIGHWRGDTAPSSCRVTNTDQVCNLFDNSSHMCIVLSNLWNSSVCHSHAVRGPLAFGFGQCWTTLCVWFRDDCIISIPGM